MMSYKAISPLLPLMLYVLLPLPWPTLFRCVAGFEQGSAAEPSGEVGSEGACRLSSACRSEGILVRGGEEAR